MAVAACFSTGAAFANPTNPTVVNGTATFATAGNILNITNSQNAIINWGSFSIGINELTRFIQPSALSAVLNRVVGQDPSAILGALQSNGRVFLINPNGILFGSGAQIDVAGLVASTLNLSNDDFLNNRMRFTDGAGAGSVVNQGSITGGNVYLVGNAVRNEGAITTTPGGEVVLAAGNSVELVNPGTPNLRVEIVAPDNEAKNLGNVAAEAGRIGIYAGLIDNSGTLNASSAVAEGGRILLKATKNATLAASSILDASGVGGGRIDVLADDTVRVDGRLDASAPVSGNGGLIETSGKSSVQISDTAIVTTDAPQGKTGKWLIDPNNFVIGAGADITGAALSTALGSTDIVITTTAYGGENFSGSGSYGGTQVGDILVQQNVSWNSTHSLTLTAERNVQVDNPITNTGTGGINLNAGWNGASDPTIPTISSNSAQILLNAPISSAGTISLLAGGNISQTSTAVITADKLAAVSNWGSVLLDAAPNMVNTLAGYAGNTGYFGTGGEFRFKNNQSLTIGDVSTVARGTVSGITVEGAEGGTAVVDINVASGNLTVSSPIAANGYNASWSGAGHAQVSLAATGGVTIDSSVTAQGGYGGSAYSGGNAGGNAAMTVSGASITVNGTGSLNVRGGNGGSNSWSSGVAGGGDATMTIQSTGSSVSVNNTSLNVDGGDADYFGMGGGGAANLLISSATDTTFNQSNFYVRGGDGKNGGAGGDAMLAVTAGGGISVTNSSALGVNGGSGYSGSASTRGAGGYGLLGFNAAGGNIQIDGSEGYAYGGYGSTGGSAAVVLQAAGSVLLSNYYGILFASSGYGYTSGVSGPAAVIVGAAGNVSMTNADAWTNGDFGIAGANVLLDNSYVSASGVLVVGALGNLDVLNGSSLQGYGNAIIGTTGSVTVDNSTIMGSPDVLLNVGGTINQNNGGTIQAGAPSTIYLTFPMLTQGGYFVNGIEGVVFDTVTGTGFMAGGLPAILGTNLLVTYGSPNLVVPTDNLIVAMGESTKPPDPEKNKDIFVESEDEKKKNAPVCR